jgi:putative membrane protein
MLACADSPNQVAAVPRPGQFSTQDYKLLAKAVHGSEMEFIFGEIGNEKSTDPSVKTFTHHILEDRQKTNDALKQLIKQKGATAPESVYTNDTRLLAQLNTLTGPAFDKGYMDAMVQEYQSAIKDLQAVSAAANDGDLLAWVNQTVPVWQEHLQMARNTDAAVANANPAGGNG